ncbi:MAG: hypothetical protein KatS3mg115_1652 [Candidatus Poribacteria bacterium]|nr:MAG: hypothetical protein KatS3mg115_1652 [Candidatus Poribacteria bacterium]
MERSLFGGDFALWVTQRLHLGFDQRNAVVVGIAMGFAVIPLIFTIAEDALSRVPTSLRTASLALGATEWQTAWRVMLPSAAPGDLFRRNDRLLVGPIGETMIMLMATGNTPVMDWNPFNGMRTLSANIAVELPEAPVGGTLYRVLFLTAVFALSGDVLGEHARGDRSPPAPGALWELVSPGALRWRADPQSSETSLVRTRPHRLGLWRRGDPFLWLTGGAVALSLLMILGLLGTGRRERGCVTFSSVRWWSWSWSTVPNGWASSGIGSRSRTRRVSESRSSRETATYTGWIMCGFPRRRSSPRTVLWRLWS